MGQASILPFGTQKLEAQVIKEELSPANILYEL